MSCIKDEILVDIKDILKFSKDNTRSEQLNLEYFEDLELSLINFVTHLFRIKLL